MAAPPCWSRALFSRERRLRRSSAHILLVFSDEDGFFGAECDYCRRAPVSRFFIGAAPAFRRAPPASVHP